MKKEYPNKRNKEKLFSRACVCVSRSENETVYQKLPWKKKNFFGGSSYGIDDLYACLLAHSLWDSFETALRALQDAAMALDYRRDGGFSKRASATRI